MNLLKLYTLIPDFECIAGCHKCCGKMFVSPWEFKRIRLFLEHKLKNKVPWGGGKDMCCFIANGKGNCSIYTVRPLGCRMFGTIKELYCFMLSGLPVLTTRIKSKAGKTLRRSGQGRWLNTLGYEDKL